MIDAKELVGIVFSGLSSLVIEDVEDAGDTIVVRARTRSEPVACPGCGEETSHVHGYRGPTPADVPVDGRRVVVKMRVRRMRCPALDCQTQTFREQVPGVLEPYQRRITRLTGQVSATVRELAGRAGSRLLAALGISVSRHTALRALMAIRLPDLGVPRILGIDDFALRKGLVYATILIDAETGRRVDVLEGRTAAVAEDWLRQAPRRRDRVQRRVGGVRRGREVSASGRRAVRRPLAPVASPRRSRGEGGRRALGVLGGSRPASAGETRRDHARALAPGPRPAQQGRRAAGLLAAAFGPRTPDMAAR